MPYDLIDGTVIEKEGGYYQIAGGNLHEIERCWVNEKNRRAIRVPSLCAMKYEMKDMLVVPNYTVVTADHGKTFYYIEGQKKGGLLQSVTCNIFSFILRISIRFQMNGFRCMKRAA